MIVILLVDCDRMPKTTTILICHAHIPFCVTLFALSRSALKVQVTKNVAKKSYGVTADVPPFEFSRGHTILCINIVTIKSWCPTFWGQFYSTCQTRWSSNFIVFTDTQHEEVTRLLRAFVEVMKQRHCGDVMKSDAMGRSTTSSSCKPIPSYSIPRNIFVSKTLGVVSSYLDSRNLRAQDSHVMSSTQPETWFCTMH